MEAIYPFSALRAHQREVKDAAQKDVVRITENGSGAYVFCSEEVFARRIREAAEEAAYAERMAAALRESKKDIEEGHFVEGTEAAFREILNRRAAHA